MRFSFIINNRELKQPRRNLHIWQWKTGFLHALQVHFSSLDISQTFSFFLRREMTCCVDDLSIWWQMFNFVFLCPKRWFQFNSRIVRTHFSSKMTFNNWKLIAETQSYFFGWRSRFRRRRVCLSSLIIPRARMGSESIAHEDEGRMGYLTSPSFSTSDSQRGCASLTICS